MEDWSGFLFAVCFTTIIVIIGAVIGGWRPILNIINTVKLKKYKPQISWNKIPVKWNLNNAYKVFQTLDKYFALCDNANVDQNVCIIGDENDIMCDNKIICPNKDQHFYQVGSISFISFERNTKMRTYNFPILKVYEDKNADVTLQMNYDVIKHPKFIESQFLKSCDQH